MKNTLQWVFILLFFKCGYSQTVAWAKSIGEQFEVSMTDRGTSVQTDSQGNVYVSGFFTGTVNFNPESETEDFIFTANEWEDAYVQKLNAQGELLWVKVFSSAGTFDQPVLLVDSLDNVYVVGLFVGEIDLNPNEGTDVRNSTGYSYNTYIVKLDSQGGYVYGKCFENSTENMEAMMQTVTLDSDDNIIIGGLCQAAVDFDFGEGEFILNATGEKTFISKYDPNANLIWAKIFEGNYYDLDFCAVATDSENNILLGGGYISTVDLDPGEGVYEVTSPAYDNRDLLLLKLDADGGFVWARSAEGAYTPGTISYDELEIINSLVIDEDDSIYFSGFFRSYINLDPPGTDFVFDTGVSSPDAVGNSNMYGKIDADGNIIWARFMEGANTTSAVNFYGGPSDGSIVTLKPDGVLVYGMSFRGELELEVSGVENTFSTQASGVVFMEMDSEAGDCNAAYFINNDFNTLLGGLAVRGDYMYATGSFNRTLSFNEDVSLTSGDFDDDAYVVKFSPVTLGTETFTLQTVPSAYPNPAIGNVYISKAGRDINSVTIIDLSGKIVKEFTSFSNEDTENINLGSLSQGMYILQIESGKEKFVKKLIVK